MPDQRRRAGDRQDADVGDRLDRARRDRQGANAILAMGEMAPAGEVAEAIAFLACGAASLCLRPRLDVDGGWRRRTFGSRRLTRSTAIRTASAHQGTMRTPTMTTDNPPRRCSGTGSDLQAAGSTGVRRRAAGIRKSFGQVEVLHGVDLTVRGGRARGHLRAVRLGQVDAAAHDQPARGAERGLRARARGGVRARPGGRKRGKPMELRRQVGMVFQQFNLFPHLTALDNMRSSLRSSKRMRRPRGRGAGRRARSVRSGSCDFARRATRRSSRAASSSAWRSRGRSASIRR